MMEKKAPFSLNSFDTQSPFIHSLRFQNTDALSNPVEAFSPGNQPTARGGKTLQEFRASGAP